MIALSLTLMVAAANPSQPRDVALTNNTKAFHNLLVAQADMPPPPPGAPDPYAGWTRGQLQMEYDRLDGTKPSIVGPIVLLAVGGGLTIVGASIILTGIGWGYFLVNLIVGSVFLVPGIILLIVGAIMLPGRLAERRAIGDRQDAIKARIDYAPPDGQPGYGPPPPPPPGAQQQNLLDVQPTYALLEF